MKLLDRYLGKTVLFSVIGVLTLIVGLDAVFAFIGEMDDIEKAYQMPQVVQYVALTLPARIYEFVPVATLIGCLLGLGALASTNELTVMRAAGVSVTRIVLAAIKPVMLVIGLSMTLGQFVVPATEQYAESQKTLLTEGTDMVSVRQGFWYREQQDFLHIRAIQPNGVIFGVARYRFNDGLQLTEIDFAARGIYQGDHWMLEDVRQTRLQTDRIADEHFDTLRWDTSITPKLLSIVTLSPTNLSVTDLFRYAQFRREQSLESGQYYFAFWQKALQPVAIIVMVFIAASFIFGPLRSVTMGQRLITGIVVGLGFNYGQQMLGHVSVVYSMPPVIAAVLPIAVFMILGLRMLRRI